MPLTPRPDRDEQIKLMLETEARIDGYMRRWLANPEFKAALHRYDGDGGEDTPSQQPRRAVG